MSTRDVPPSSQLPPTYPTPRTSPSPPPSYADATGHDPPGPADTPAKHEQEHEDELTATTSPAAIVITIDASTSVDGRDNTVVFPAAVPVAPTPRLDADSETQHELAALRKFVQLRQLRSAQLTSAVVAALRHAGLLHDAASGRARAIEVRVDAGLRVRGEGNNVVCAGPSMHRAAAAGAAGAKRKRSGDAEPVGPTLLRDPHLLSPDD
ncbi:hypothetical protein KEM52_002457 [Ascosphaera acerosa]|nr:hypothetical protein KEM52_002457 [Ascosphaera acerosa]